MCESVPWTIQDDVLIHKVSRMQVSPGRADLLDMKLGVKVVCCKLVAQAMMHPLFVPVPLVPLSSSTGVASSVLVVKYA